MKAYAVEYFNNRVWHQAIALDGRYTTIAAAEGAIKLINNKLPNLYNVEIEEIEVYDSPPKDVGDFCGVLEMKY